MNGVIGVWDRRKCQAISKLRQKPCHGKASRVLKIGMHTALPCEKDQREML